MSALPRPDLPPGPHRDLVAALHDLHHRAGWPSLRALAAAPASPTPPSPRSSPRPALPTWGTLELLVEAMDGDTAPLPRAVARRHRAHRRDRPCGATDRRTRAELAAVRRHLETGTGLLLVTGEAGIGKTTLVAAARDR